MSNPADTANAEQVATQPNDDMGYSDKATETKNQSFASKVNDVVSKMTQNDKGEWEVPSDITDEAVRYAAVQEKRFRDTQGSYTKERQKNKALEVEVSVLKTKAVSAVKLNLTEAQAEELEELKFSDPEQWRKKVNAYETNAVAEQQKQIEEEVSNTTKTTLEQDELETRKVQLSDFLKAHQGFELNDDIIANDIPPRITNKLKNGDITFEEFLQACYSYIKTGKVVKQDEAPRMPNLSKVGGGASPDTNAIKEDIYTSYSKEVY